MHAYRLETLLSLGLLLGTLALFDWTCRNDFVNYDDDLYVYANPHVRAGLNVKEATWAFTTFELANWHPLTWLSLELDSQIYGMAGRVAPSPNDAFGFHLTNTLL